MMNSQVDKRLTAGQTFSLVYGDEVIHYTVAIRPYDNGKVLIKVHDDGRVIAHAPASADLVAVRDAMRQRAAWVWCQLVNFRRYQQDIQPKQYLSGESHFYLGRHYLLKVIHSDARDVDSVKLTRGRFEASLHAVDRLTVKTQLERWYQLRAGEVFKRRLKVLLPHTPWVNSPPELRWQKMRKQWGNCSTDNVLTLNTHLVKAPRDCIDYVILHELCHMRERNHSRCFYQLLATTLPDWETRKAHLDQRAFAFLA